MSLVFAFLYYLGLYFIVGLAISALAVVIYGTRTLWIHNETKARKCVDVFLFALLWPVLAFIMLQNAYVFIKDWMKGGDDE
jgi:hypothetical protein